MSQQVNSLNSFLGSVLTPEEVSATLGWLDGDSDVVFLKSSAFDKLYDHYLSTNEMPYGVAKARDEDPLEWIRQRLEQLSEVAAGGAVGSGSVASAPSRARQIGTPIKLSEATRSLFERDHGAMAKAIVAKIAQWLKTPRGKHASLTIKGDLQALDSVKAAFLKALPIEFDKDVVGGEVVYAGTAPNGRFKLELIGGYGEITVNIQLVPEKTVDDLDESAKFSFLVYRARRNS